MFRSKSILFMMFAICGLTILSSSTADAQFNQSAKDTAFYSNNPCTNPKISWVLWNESAGMTKPAGGVDCNAANYENWSTGAQLVAACSSYRNKLRAQNVTMTAPATSADRHVYQSVLKNGAVVFFVDYGLVASGAGNLVASGGGNILINGGGSLIASGGGNFRGVMGAGDTVVQFPGRWVKVTRR